MEELQGVERAVAEGGFSANNRFPTAVVREGVGVAAVTEILQRLQDDVFIVDGHDAAAVALDAGDSAVHVIRRAAVDANSDGIVRDMKLFNDVENQFGNGRVDIADTVVVHARENDILIVLRVS